MLGHLMGEQIFERPTLSERGWLLRVLRAETVGGMLMLGAALVALVWANTAWVGSYQDLISTTIGPESLHLNLPISVWAADFLLAFFFFLAGLELKHEVQIGHPEQALPGRCPRRGGPLPAWSCPRGCTW